MAKYRCVKCGATGPCDCQERRSNETELRAMSFWCHLTGQIVEVQASNVDNFHREGCQSCGYGTHTEVSFKCPACKRTHTVVL